MANHSDVRSLVGVLQVDLYMKFLVTGTILNFGLQDSSNVTSDNPRDGGRGFQELQKNTKVHKCIV